jgi:hypothetical protein
MAFDLKSEEQDEACNGLQNHNIVKYPTLWLPRREQCFVSGAEELPDSPRAGGPK